MDLQESAIALIRERFPAALLRTGEHRDQRWAEIDRLQTVEVLKALRDGLSFEFLMDLTCADWLGREAPERFSMVYQLFSFRNNQGFRVKTWVPEQDPEVPSVSALWKSAAWAEREVWDMFGIRFRGLADHRRLLTPADYPGHPLRKDYPLVGRGERSNFPHYVK